MWITVHRSWRFPMMHRWRLCPGGHKHFKSSRNAHLLDSRNRASEPLPTDSPRHLMWRWRLRSVIRVAFACAATPMDLPPACDCSIAAHPARAKTVRVGPCCTPRCACAGRLYNISKARPFGCPIGHGLLEGRSWRPCDPAFRNGGGRHDLMSATVSNLKLQYSPLTSCLNPRVV